MGKQDKKVKLGQVDNLSPTGERVDRKHNFSNLSETQHKKHPLQIKWSGEGRGEVTNN